MSEPSHQAVPVSAGSPSISESGDGLVRHVVPVLFCLWLFGATWLTALTPQLTLPRLTLCSLATALLMLGALWGRGKRLALPSDVRPLLLALGASMLVSNVLLFSYYTAFPRLGFYIAMALAGLAFYLMYRDGKQIPLHSYCIGIAAIHLPFLVEVVLWISRSAPDFFGYSLRMARFANPRHFGYLGFLAAMSATALLALPGRWKLESLLLTSSALFGIIATGSRGALLAWMIFVLLVAFVSTARRQILAVALAALSLSVILVWYLDVSGLLPSPNLLARVQASAEGTAPPLDSGRLVIWRDALRAIAQHPLFGFGTEGYSVSRCCNRAWAQPHNFILQLLLQFGVVGSALLAALCWRAVRALGGWRRIVALTLASPVNLVLAAMLVSYMAFAMIDGLLYREMPLVHFALFCGLFAAGLRTMSVQLDRSGAEQQRAD